MLMAIVEIGKRYSTDGKVRGGTHTGKNSVLTISHDPQFMPPMNCRRIGILLSRPFPNSRKSLNGRFRGHSANLERVLADWAAITFDDRC
jgi:hypothetical protein